MNRTRSPQDGVSIIEILVATTILALVVTSLYVLYGQSMRATKTAYTAAIAQNYLRSQFEQLRNCGWLALSGTIGLPSSILPQPLSPPFTSANLADASCDTTLWAISNPADITQTLSIYPELTSSAPSPSPTPYYTITRSGIASRGAPSPAVTASVSGTMLAQTALTYVIRLQWSDRGRTYFQEYSSVMSQYGTQ